MRRELIVAARRAERLKYLKWKGSLLMQNFFFSGGIQSIWIKQMI